MSQIQIPGYYIAVRETEKGKKIQQHVKIDGITKGHNGDTLYRGYYGIYGYHELFCKLEEIRGMTQEEQEFHNSNQYYNLPQQFFQSPFGSSQVNSLFKINNN